MFANVAAVVVDQQQRLAAISNASMALTAGSRERKESYFVREQFAIILLLIGGFLISGFFVGIGLIAFGIWEAILMYREAFKPSGEELLGRKRAENMIAAIVIMIPVYMFAAKLTNAGKPNQP